MRRRVYFHPSCTMRKKNFYLKELTLEQLDVLLKKWRIKDIIKLYRLNRCQFCAEQQDKQIYLIYTRILTRKDIGELISLHQDCITPYFRRYLKRHKQWRRIKAQELFYINLYG